MLDGIADYLARRDAGAVADPRPEPAEAPEVAADKRVRETRKAVREAEKRLRDARRTARTALREARARHERA
ncbi:hypothetical protein GCM10025870_07020 [Agromyces marinus]|uniref:Uncharacterized protein n=1 Tax=Agromyces marinus TaxID=1389020 RepID=A0ABN6Y8J5_9MICO|nr:hypothetical protein [Agromyces marinus]BDZ53629.1 hypothetical protein GCM10025870_07020 [Agromyces marinus]